MKEVKFKFEDLKVYAKALNFVDLAYKTYKSFLKYVVCSTIAKHQNYISAAIENQL